MIRPSRLKKGDELRVIAPAKSVAIVSDDNKRRALECLENDFGFKVSFGAHCNETDAFQSSSVASRVSDLHEAFADPKVKGILTVLGGYNSNQMLEHIDYGLIRKNPKVFCGFSDITALSNAIYKKTSMVTFSGPHFSTFACEKGMDYTLDYFAKCFLKSDVIEVKSPLKWSDDTWYLDQKNRTFITNDGMEVINPGFADGTIIGGNLCTLNLLHGTPYMPDLAETVLFVEDDYLVFPEIFDRDLQSLVMQTGFESVRAVVIGRFQKESKMTLDLLTQICRSKPQLAKLPTIANVDFGHTLPMITFPIGGKATVDARDKSPKLSIEW
jgi:muramoyltetrapeptide carboxypeptidase